MPVLEANALMTTEELLAMPEDGMDRWLIQGQLKEKPMTVHNMIHSRCVIRVGKYLDNWLDKLPKPRGMILGGEAGVKLARNPDTTVGIDVVYVSHELAARRAADTTLVDGVPILVVEILSPSDTVEEINEKIDQYLAVGVPLIWIVDPYRQTVQICRPGHDPDQVNRSQELSGEPQLPGFRVAVSELFE